MTSACNSCARPIAAWKIICPHCGARGSAMSTPEQRAEAGAAFLDDVEPDWFTRINLRELDLEDGCLCVLGQLSSCFTDGLQKYHVKIEDATKFGFVRWATQSEYPRLTEHWTTLIEKRLAERGLMA